MVLIIDNYDSFTFNLYQQISSLGYAAEVVKHDAIDLAGITAKRPTHIVISPGPGRPADSGISMEAIRAFYQTMPLLGVCLGHQCIGEVFGSRTVRAPTVMHGKTDRIHHAQTGIFKNAPNPLTVARYHSLVLDNLPPNFSRSAWSADGSIMALQHQQYPLFGVQFHPESFMTEQGEILMKGFLACAAN